MFSQELLEKIFAKKDVQTCPIAYLSSVIRAIEEVLEEQGINLEAKGE